ncbi:nucleoside hydrolase [Natronorubrum sp. JWXQ-INN-674]|uniref:Nucleoside hydrolase n=1 Tax=Natronorubrum halalkaliphilum TaxID=2691917 RepID=A0A6B0VFK4_9EURY|nr:nucleoside hydrolase [Natronorubrum halalkaliphilum]MXV60551.1 nucleoside hydrolase [Natronorubrum halalkaliphilum]
MENVLLDVDPGCDDAVLLAFMLARDDVDVVGVTTVAGNTTVDNTTKNALSILEHFDRTEIPVARGCHRPIVDELELAEWVHGEDGLRGDLPEPETEPIETHATEFIIEQAHAYGEELTIASVGPQTNLATALILEPDLPDLVGEIYQMGGAAMTSGNTTPMAEFNFYNDPAAASRVIQDGAPRMVGLDATNDASVPASTITEFQNAGAPLEVIGSWLDYPSEIVSGDLISIHDAAVGVDIVEDVLTFEEYYAEIDTSGGPSHGAVICDEHRVLDEPANIEVAVEIDTERFCEILLDALWSLE